MSNAEKLYVAMQNHPLNWRIDDVETVARYFGLTVSRPGKGGSHVTFRDADANKVVVPARKPIKVVYIIKFIKLIENLQHE